jgi:hypothetical protein
VVSRRPLIERLLRPGGVVQFRRFGDLLELTEEFGVMLLTVTSYLSVIRQLLDGG